MVWLPLPFPRGLRFVIPSRRNRAVLCSMARGAPKLQFSATGARASLNKLALRATKARIATAGRGVTYGRRFELDRRVELSDFLSLFIYDREKPAGHPSFVSGAEVPSARESAARAGHARQLGLDQNGKAYAGFGLRSNWQISGGQGANPGT